MYKQMRGKKKIETSKTYTNVEQNEQTWDKQIKKAQIDTCPSKTSFKLSLCQLLWSAIEQIVDALHVIAMVAGDEYKKTAD